MLAPQQLIDAAMRDLDAVRGRDRAEEARLTIRVQALCLGLAATPRLELVVGPDGMGRFERRLDG